MGIFSLFGKKDGRSDRSAADTQSSRGKRSTGSSSQSANKSIEAASVQRNVARATSIKIDAIESEMSNEFVDTRTTDDAVSRITAHSRPADTMEETLAPDIHSLMPAGNVQTGFLLGGDKWSAGTQASDAEGAQIIDEAAILFANNQNEIVAHLLQDAIARDSLGAATKTVWWMLLDLYQVTGNQESFENLSIEYASKFETSPPAWKEMLPTEKASDAEQATASPIVIFSGKLDASIAKQLERIQKLSASHTALRLEFVRLTSVDPIGCGLVLRMLQRVRKAGLGLVLVGAPELARQIRLILQVGRRDETEAPWLLLLELLQLLNQQAEFEETSIDYCITFEVSPPPFTAPETRVTTAQDETALPMLPSGHYPMPAVVEGKVDQLVGAIGDHAALHQPAILDCSALIRVEFGAAGQLLDGLAPLCANGRHFEFHEVNHLVAALFHVMGISNFMRVITRKN